MITIKRKGSRDRHVRRDRQHYKKSKHENLVQSKPNHFSIMRSKAFQWCFLLGTALLFLGLITSIWTPTEMILYDRLKMATYNLPYKWWKNTPDYLEIKIYIFNCTNHEALLAGEADKMHVEEIGPFIFTERIVHTNVTHNYNGTLTYQSKRIPIYLPDRNTIDLQQNLIVPNWGVLGMAAYAARQNFLFRMSFHALYRKLKPNLFVNITVQNILYNFTESFVETANTIAPSIVPEKNMGILKRFYPGIEATTTVYIGPENGHEKFFHLHSLDGSINIPKYDPSRCGDTLENATDGVMFSQYLKKGDNLKFYRANVCRNVILEYEGETVADGLNAYRYKFPEATFNRTYPSELDCYRGEPSLPDGLADVSKCYFDFPLVMSFPHFLHADPVVQNSVTGLKPDPEKHNGFAIIEPKTGVPMGGVMSSQCSIAMGELGGIDSSFRIFKNTVVPLFWIHIGQVGLPWYITWFLYIGMVVLPIAQKIFAVFAVAFQLTLMYHFVRPRWRRWWNINLEFPREMETFIISKKHSI